MTMPVVVDRSADQAVLDDPVRHSLLGDHAWLGERRGRVHRYRPDVAPFHTLPPDPVAQDWRDLAELAGAGHPAVLTGPVPALPAGWTITSRIDGVQLVATAGVPARRDPEAARLGPADVPEMLALVEQTAPGPFHTHTYLFGNYWGLRHQGRLVAMAGQRLSPPGWSEISAVCTAPDQRGQGLASRLIATVVDGIRHSGRRPFLHTSAANTGAIRLYESLGFELRRTTTFTGVALSD